jgi:hypothetical protein
MPGSVGRGAKTIKLPLPSRTYLVTARRATSVTVSIRPASSYVVRVIGRPSPIGARLHGPAAPSPGVQRH